MLRRMAESAHEPISRRRRKLEHIEEPEGLSRPAARPAGTLDHSPLPDPLRHIKRPLRALNGPAPGRAYVEFTPDQIVEIRYRFHATRRQFARMFGISAETLKNWEQGRRRPHGPARALLRLAKANPDLVARTLWRYRRAWWMD